MSVIIRKAVSSDAQMLCELYAKHLTTNPPKEKQDINEWEKMLQKFEIDDHYYLMVAEIDGRVVSSVTVIIIENLTHNRTPYAVIENVVTHSDYRNKGYASALMNKVSDIAKEFNCHKIMLLTGSKKETTLKFYESCGFNRHEKTGFIKRLSEE